MRDTDGSLDRTVRATPARLSKEARRSIAGEQGRPNAKTSCQMIRGTGFWRFHKKLNGYITNMGEFSSSTLVVSRCVRRIALESSTSRARHASSSCLCSSFEL